MRPFQFTLLFSLSILLIFNIPRQIHLVQEFKAFLSSCASMGTLMILFGASVYPHMVYSLPETANTLTIYNGSSTEKNPRLHVHHRPHWGAHRSHVHRLRVLHLPQQSGVD